MKRIVLLWVVAFIVTAVSAVYQRMTGPTYPLSGKAQIGETRITYKLLRSQAGVEDALVSVAAADPTITGNVDWKRLNSADPWSTLPMERAGDSLKARLPHQPPAGKIEYRVILAKAEEHISLPDEGAAVLRYKGDVPTAILIVHILAMFGAMLLSARTGLEFFNPEPRMKQLIYWTIGFLAFGGLVMGPLVQKYAFDAYWTGWPFGTDMTDNKTFVGLLGWIVAAIALGRSRNPKRWALGAAVFLFVIYLIPHSVLGSELDYSKEQQVAPRERESGK